MNHRRGFITTVGPLLGAAAVGLPFNARAAGFPEKPIRMIVPYAAGGSADGLGRVMAQAMGDILGQPVLVDLKPGAGGNIGAELVAGSAPGDGYTILLASVSLSTSMSFTKLNFDPRTDLMPLAGICNQPSLLVVSASSPYKSLADIIKAGKSGTAINFASSGNTTGSHLFGELLKANAGFPATHVPYRGTGAAYPDLVAGRISMMFDVMSSALPQVTGGSVRAIALTSDHRSKLLPDVPTLAELGYKGFEVGTWFGFFAPLRTPTEALDKLESAALRAMKNKDVAVRLEAAMAEPIPGPRDQFGRWYLAEVDRWAKFASEHKDLVVNK